MKTVPNPTFTIKLPNGQDATAKDLLLLCIDFSPQGGFDLPTQRARNRIADVLEKTGAGAEIALEDADYTVAQEAIKGMKWGGRHKDIPRFAELFGV